MKARIIDKVELGLSPANRQAEALLSKLNADNAVEVHLDNVSARTIRRTFSKAAAKLGLSVEVRTRDRIVYVLLKPEGDPRKAIPGRRSPEGSPKRCSWEAGERVNDRRGACRTDATQRYREGYH